MSKCRSVDKEVVCFTDPTSGVRSTRWQHTVYDAKGQPIGHYYTTADNVIDASVTDADVTPGSCPVYNPDVEWEELCDVLADGSVVPFMRRSVTNFTTAGTPIDPVVVNDFALDKVTAYAVAGTVGVCPDCGNEAPLGLITDLAQLD